MKLSSITIRGMHKVKDTTYDLTGFKYFYGPNGAGKSTVMQAVQLALLGYIPGTNKNKSAIFKHSNGPEMFIHLVIDNGGTPINIIRKWYKKGKDIAYIYEIEPAFYNTENIVGSLELPVFNFSEFIGMTANQLKDWFINFLPAVNSNLNWNTILMDSIADFGTILDIDYVNEIISYINNQCIDGCGIQTVRDFNTYLKEQLSYYKSEITRLQGTIQSLIYYDDCDSSESIEEIKQKISSAEANITNLNCKLIKIQQLERLIKDMEKAKSMLNGEYDSEKSLDENLNANSEYVDALNIVAVQSEILSDSFKSKETASAKAIQLETEIFTKSKILNSGGTCPYTCAKCDTILKMISQFKTEIEQLESELKKVKAAENAAILQNIEAGKAKNEANAKLEKIRQAYISYGALDSQLHPEDVDINEKESIQAEIDSLKSTVKAYTDTIIKLEANKKYAELTNHITNDKFKAEQNAEILKVWIKLTDVNGLQSQLMAAPFAKLADDMSLYLQKFFANSSRITSAKFNLAEKANSFSFGVIDHQGNYIEFDLLSSGEKCLYTLALLLSIVDSSDSPLKLIMIDDLLDHLDSIKINDCFLTLYSISTIQILLAGVQNCNHPNADEFVTEISG